MKIIYTCSKCDSQSPKWSGRCLECGSWGTLEKSNLKKEKTKEEKVVAGKTVSFEQVKIKNNLIESTNLKEVDRVLGGGIVDGSLILLGGDPGIGKSTLALQLANLFSGKVLYVSGEESAEQVKLRWQRLKNKKEEKTTKSSLKFLGEEDVKIIKQTIIEEKPRLVVVDSVQTIYTDEVSGESGGVNQIRAATLKFLEIAKKEKVPILLIGHVTKDGSLAGPKTLEHLVDVVLYLEGDQHNQYRILRAVKNRFGSTKEVGIFDMKSEGLLEVENPTKIFLQHRSDYPGSCLTALSEGSRVFLVEVQALVTKTVFGYPVRKASGFDANRLQMLLAVLTKRLRLPLGTQDVHLNVIGGMKVNDPGADLAVCLAVITAFSDKILPKDLVVFGEIGLGGEIRPGVRSKERIRQVKQLGYKNIISSDQAKSLSEVIKLIK